MYIGDRAGKEKRKIRKDWKPLLTESLDLFTEAPKVLFALKFKVD